MWFYSFIDFDMYATLIDESDQMGLTHGVMTVAVPLKMAHRPAGTCVVPGLFHAMFRAFSMLALRSDIETKRFLSDSRSITPNTDRFP